MTEKIRMGFGTWMNLSQDSLNECLIAVNESQYDFIDTAFVYYNEAKIGKALKRMEKLGTPNHLPIQSKVWVSQFNNVRGALQLALKKLGVNQLWSYLLHRPDFDMNVNLKAWKQLIKCQQVGMVEHIGVSNFDKDMIKYLIAKTGVKPAFNQIELSVNNFRKDRVVYNTAEDIIVQAWSPMGTLKQNLKNPVLLKIAKAHKTDVPSILIAFLATQGICLIAKTQNPERAKNNPHALKIKLTNQEMLALSELNTYTNKASETFYSPSDEPQPD